MTKTKRIKYTGGGVIDLPDMRLQFSHDEIKKLPEEMADLIVKKYQNFEIITDNGEK